MQFLRPDFLWLLALGVVPVLLYLFRRKSRQIDVSTLVFFKTLAREHQESSWLRKLKRLLSFLLTMAVLVAAVFSLARLVRGPGEKGNYRSCVVLIDRGASMALRDSGGRSRLEAGRDLLHARLQSISEEAGVSLIAYDVRPEVVQPRTRVRRELLSRLDQIRIRPVPGKEAPALNSAFLLAGLETPALILHVSDFGQRRGEQWSGPEERIPPGVTIEEINVAVDSPVNVGITSFQIRKTPLEQDAFDVYARVELNRSAPDSREVHLELFVGGMPSQVRDLELNPGDRENFEFRVRGAGGQVLRMHIRAEGDSFDLDDTVLTMLPKPDPIVAVWIRENSEDQPQDAYTNLALSAIQESGSLELLAGSPDQWPLREKADAVIFDGWLPETWPRDLPAVVINPPRSCGPVLAQKLNAPIPYDSVRAGNSDHPVLFRVSSTRVAITQTALIEPSGSFEPLWIAGREPVLAAGEAEGKRLVVMAFSPQLSERLPLTASFPLLLGNAVLWVAENSDLGKQRLQSLTTGDFADLGGAESIVWTEWAGNALRRREFPLESRMLEMTRLGIWQTGAGHIGTSHLLSPGETDLPGRPVAAERSEKAATQGEWFATGNLTRFFLLVILIVLLLESWLFHRHAVY